DGQGQDFATIKYSPDGDLLWVSRYDYKGWDDSPNAMAVDGSGSIYISGYSERAMGKGDFFTIKLNADGTHAWARRYSPGDYYNSGNDIGLDGSGNVYAAGYSHSTYDGKYLTVVKYSPSSTIMGDANGDGVINVGDAVHIIAYIFRGGPVPNPLENADANCDNRINIGDAIFLINYMFKGGYAPNCM
ncbi:MAG: dockerin type I domain-containing protein, partial [candidate division Zixibacteria bacterium]|nr:dockerin type I domain-containing protein [candidate division Zixibacteria bacterium]